MYIDYLAVLCFSLIDIMLSLHWPFKYLAVLCFSLIDIMFSSSRKILIELFHYNFSNSFPFTSK